MLQNYISDAKEQYAHDYADDTHLDDKLEAFEEGLVTALTHVFELSLRGSLSFDIVE